MADEADEAKRPRLDLEATDCSFLADEKVQQVLAKYSSTVFACDTSADTRYIKCDFPRCSEHSGSDQAKPSWILNTVKNVRTLEKHVGKEVAKFMKENLPSCCDNHQSTHYATSRDVVRSQRLRPETKKVLAVFNLADPQSQLGEWISLFLKTSQLMLGPEIAEVEVITQSFTSRYELVSCITNLQFIRKYSNVDVLAVLSCHSSSQGQVFSCTPSVISRQIEYEEFCSLHDFVQVLQDSLGLALTAVHISSCFTLKLDCSHQDWPVDVDWLRTKLNCTLSGSTKEVYETGSQVADLYVILASLLKPLTALHSIGDSLKSAIQSAASFKFPDLAREMGLEILWPENSWTKTLQPCIDEEVSAPSQVTSSVHVVFLIGHDGSFSDDCQLQERSNNVHQALAEAIAANLRMRRSSDVKCKYSLRPLHTKSSLKDNLQSWIYSALDTGDKLFFVALGSSLAHPSVKLLNVLREIILESSRPGWFYGIHFQNLTPMQAYYLKTSLSKANTRSYEVAVADSAGLNGFSEGTSLVATGLVAEGKPSPVNAFPVLLYMIHLAIGENGERRSGHGITPAHLKYKQYKGPGISSWTLEDVYMETSYVLSGLSRDVGLCLLSFPMQMLPHNKRMESVCRASERDTESSCNSAEIAAVDSPKTNEPVSEQLDASNEISLDETNVCVKIDDVLRRRDQTSSVGTSVLSEVCKHEDKSSIVDRAVVPLKLNENTFQAHQCFLDTSDNSEVCKLNGNPASDPIDAEKHLILTEKDCARSATSCDSVSCAQVRDDSSEDEYVCITDDESCRDHDPSSSDSKWDTSKDLPLMANVDEVLVSHYILNLEVKFEEKVMTGDITLFLKPATDSVLKRQFQLCLDCSLVHIESVEEVNLKEDFCVKFYGVDDQFGDDNASCSAHPSDIFQLDKVMRTPLSLPYTLLPYAVHNWCVRIWKPRNLGESWPRCVRIKYRTRPEGKSLTWAIDQDQRPCVFSPGAYINNRSLMPCQEPPVAMSTWQASIHVPKGCVVLMSGNQLPVQESYANMDTSLYEMKIPLPCSTLALAIGRFECRQSSAPTLSSRIPCRVFSAPSVINRASDELLKPCQSYVSAACHLLGPYPFSRLDLVILPRCFACMGLMSPNVAFLSQSILAGDESMCVRVAHEISHSWFGLLIGAKDWSEEWLSEGFATYMEERIQCKAEGWHGDEEVFRVELRQILRHRTLLAELQHADENMQRLRPKLPKIVTAAEAVRRSVDSNKIKAKISESDNGSGDSIIPHTTVTNGQVCSRKWTQIHYLKGYFLLHYMASMVGSHKFDNLLREYVKEYGGKLVNSDEFFEYFQKSFPSLGHQNVKDQLIQEWLECPGLPKHCPQKIGRPDNFFINQVENEFAFWKKTDAANKRRKTQHIRRKKPIKDHPKLSDPIQLVVFLERMLERDTLATTTLTQLDNCYNFQCENAEVRHRWCELVVKHRYSPGFPEVKRFLIEDQGMGIYLFGELLISEQPKQKQLVLDVLSVIGAEMDQCTLKTVQDMLEGRD